MLHQKAQENKAKKPGKYNKTVSEVNYASLR